MPLCSDSHERIRYTSGQLHAVNNARRLTVSSQKSMALIAQTRKFTSRGDRAHCTAAPRLWNKLPLEIRFRASILSKQDEKCIYLLNILNFISYF